MFGKYKLFNSKNRNWFWTKGRVNSNKFKIINMDNILLVLVYSSVPYIFEVWLYENNSSYFFIFVTPYI